MTELTSYSLPFKVEQEDETISFPYLLPDLVRDFRKVLFPTLDPCEK